MNFSVTLSEMELKLTIDGQLTITVVRKPAAEFGRVKSPFCISAKTCIEKTNEKLSTKLKSLKTTDFAATSWMLSVVNVSANSQSD